MTKIKVVVFDDEPRYVEALLGLLQRDGFDALGIVVTIRPRIMTPEDVVHQIKAFGPAILIADRECWGDEGFGIRVIRLCSDMAGLLVLSSTSKPLFEMSQLAHQEFRGKEDLSHGCQAQARNFAAALQRLVKLHQSQFVTV